MHNRPSRNYSRTARFQYIFIEQSHNLSLYSIFLIKSYLDPAAVPSYLVNQGAGNVICTVLSRPDFGHVCVLLRNRGDSDACKIVQRCRRGCAIIQPMAALHDGGAQTARSDPKSTVRDRV